LKGDNVIFLITEKDLQDEAINRIGRELTDEEIEIAKDGFEWGFRTCALDVTYNTIFTEMI